MRYDLYDDEGKYITSFYDAMDADFYAAENDIHDIREVHACKGCNQYKEDVQVTSDYHGIFTGYYCSNCYDNNYPYRKDDYTNGTGVADDGTPLEIN